MSKPGRKIEPKLESSPASVSNPGREKEAAAEWVETSALKPWSRNPRKNEANVARVVSSIKRFGFAAPILARRADGEVIAGHTRLLAAKKLGLDRVPVRYLDLDPADAHLLALADNRLTDLGEWDEDGLLQLLGELRQQGNDAALVAGWNDAEIDKMLKDSGNEILAAEPAEPELGGLQYRIVIECATEAEQSALLERFTSEGLNCKPLIS